MADNLTDIANRASSQWLNATQGAATERDELGVVGGAVLTTLSGALELFGADPLPKVEDFRKQHPKTAAVAGFAGTLAPFIATGKAGTSFKPFATRIDEFASKGTNPFSQGARRGVATFAPLEAARLASTAIINPDQLGDTVLESTANIALEAITGGVFGALSAGGKIIKTPPAQLGTALNDSKQLKLRTIKSRLEGDLDEGIKDDLLNEFKGLELDIRLEEIGDRPVKLKLADPEANGRGIERLFKDFSSRKGNIRRARLAQTGKDFTSNSEWQKAMKAAGLEGNFDAVSLPRHISFGRKSDAALTKGDLMDRGRMTTIADNLLMAKTSDGNFVMAKKIVGKLDEAAQTDEYVVFRTSDPGRFAPEVKEFADTINERMLFLRTSDRTASTGSKILDAANGLIAQMPIIEFRNADAKLGLLGRSSREIAKILGFPSGEIGSSFAVQRGKAMVENYFTPALQLFKNSEGAPYAAAIWAHSRKIRDEARLFSNRLLNGEAVDDAAKRFSKVFGEPGSTGRIKLPSGQTLRSLNEIIDGMDAKDIAKFPEISEIVAGGEDAGAAISELYRAGEITKTLRDGLIDIIKLDEVLLGEVRAVQRASGSLELNPLEGHLMLSRVWDGDFRAPIRNSEGELVYMASGNTPKAADKAAEQVIAASGLRGLVFEAAEKFDSRVDVNIASTMKVSTDEYAVLAKANTKLVRTPQTFKERKNIGGFKADFTRKELKDRISSHVNDRTEFIARSTIETALDRELATLRDIDPKTFAILSKKLEQLMDIPGPLSTAVNKVSDTLLKPVLGRNSATKISAGVNEFFFATQLGMANMAFPVLNALTFAQTVFPEVSYVINAADNRVMRDYYEVAILGGSNFKPRGHMHYLSTPKIMLKSVRAMVNPDDVLNANLGRALNEGAIDPKMLEEFIGKTSIQSTTFKDVMDGEEPWFNLVRSLSSWLPSKSERFARGHAFSVGHLVGQDLLGLSDEALYQFSKKFTERTMYNYGTSDRALVMTGPVGRMFGLFKNWQTHYLFSMLQYAGEGAKFGNWAPLMWQMGGTASVGGISALPLFAVANKFSEMATDKSAMENLYTSFGGTDPDGTLGNMADAVYMGLPAFLGISLSGNAAAPFNDPARDAAQMASFPQWRRMVTLGQAVGQAVDNFGVTGEHPINNQETLDKFIAALSPKVVARQFQLTNEAAVKSLISGRTAIKGLNTAEQMMFRAGFTPRRLGLAYEAADELWKDQDKRSKMTTKLGKTWLEAQREQDWDMLWRVQQQAMVAGLDIADIVRSADGLRETRGTERVQQLGSEQARASLRNLGIPGF